MLEGMLIDETIYISRVCAPLSSGQMSLIPYSYEWDFKKKGELFAIIANRTNKNIDYVSSSNDIYEILAIAGLIPLEYQIVCVETNRPTTREELEIFLSNIGIDENHILYDTSNTFMPLLDRNIIAKKVNYNGADKYRLTAPTKKELLNIAKYKIAYGAYELWHEWLLRSYGSTTKAGYDNIRVKEMEEAVKIMSYGHENIKFDFPMLTPYCLKKAVALSYPEIMLCCPQEMKQAQRLYELGKIWQATKFISPEKGQTFTGTGIIEETGVHETIDALYTGVPVEDLLT